MAVQTILCEGSPFEWFSLAEIANNEAKNIVKIKWSPKLTRQGLMMDDLRSWYGRPLNVNSWFRWPEYNDAIGGDKNSMHLLGAATDIALPGLSEALRSQFIAVWRMLCMKYGVIGGVSLYDWGIHFDSNDDPARYGGNSSKFRITDFRK